MASRYCFAITRTIPAICPKSCTTQVANSCRSVTVPNSGRSPSSARSVSVNRPGRERREVLDTHSLELGEEAGQRLATTLVEMCETIVRRRTAARTFRKDEPGARDPIRALAVDELADDDTRAPSVGPFRRVKPCRVQLMQHRVQRTRRAVEDPDALREVEGHGSLPA